MDVLKAVQTYVNKMITEVSGMKVLLLDSHTVRPTFRCSLFARVMESHACLRVYTSSISPTPRCK